MKCAKPWQGAAGLGRATAPMVQLPAMSLFGAATAIFDGVPFKFKSFYSVNAICSRGMGCQSQGALHVSLLSYPDKIVCFQPNTSAPPLSGADVVQCAI
jgi:hypothetical protein